MVLVADWSCEEPVVLTTSLPCPAIQVLDSMPDVELSCLVFPPFGLK